MENLILEIANENEDNYDLENYKERESFIQENIDGKSAEEVSEFFDDAITKLVETKVDENGGLVAITGFYYQMLVAIEYLIQMKKGLWDQIAIELHDDIVASKGKHIKFIQVKTSNRLICEVTDSTVSSMYLRSSKKIKEKDDNGKIINELNFKASDSWIDKLILKSKIFKKENGYKTEFELLTNYIILNSKTKQIDSYIGECVNKTITTEDSLYKELIEESYIKDKDLNVYKKLEYESICGEKLEELLSRFYIKCKQNSLDNIMQYVDSICHVIGTEVGGAYISSKDINWIIGELFARCNVNAENRHLVISQEEVESLFLEIKNRAMIAAEKLVEENGSSKIIESAYESIHNKYKNKTHYNVIESNILDYKDYLVNWVNINGGINKVINRYISANEISNNYVGMGEDEKKAIMEELILIPVILSTLHNELISYTDDKNLLTKHIKSNEREKISLLRVDYRKIKNIIPNIKLILSDLKVEDTLRLAMSKELSLILQGYDDQRFLIKKRIEIDTQEDESHILEDEKSIKIVYQLVDLIPGEAIKGDFSGQLDEDEWNEEELKILWQNIRGEEE